MSGEALLKAHAKEDPETNEEIMSAKAQCKNRVGPTSPKSKAYDESPKKVPRRILTRMDTTPSPKKTIFETPSPKLVVHNERDDIDEVDSDVKCFFDQSANSPIMISNGRRSIAEEIVDEGGFICGRWKNEFDVWQKWVSCCPTSNWVEMEASTQPAKAKTATKPKTIKRPAAAEKGGDKIEIAKKPAAVIVKNEKKTMIAELPKDQKKKVTAIMNALIEFETDGPGKNLSNTLNCVRSRNYHKIKTKLTKEGISTDVLCECVDVVFSAIKT